MSNANAIAANNSESLLSVRDLRTYFKTDDGIVKAVDGVSFDVGRGETFGIVGESGSGKSVTCLSAMQLVPQPPGFFPSGEILFDGEDVLKMSDAALHRMRGNRASMIFQDPMTCLNPYLRVSRQLTEVLEVHRNLGGAQAKRLATEMLERVGIPDAGNRIDQYPHQFSGGMRQRVMIAMALLCEPELLIADEPTTALDVTIQAQILELLAELQRDLGTSIVFITHDLGVVAGITDRVAVMYAGRIIETGTTEEVFGDPQHPYTRGLMHSIPRLGDSVDEVLEGIPGLPPDLSNLPNGCPFHPRCSIAQEKCGETYPEIVQLGGPDRWSACWESRAT